MPKKKFMTKGMSLILVFAMMLAFAIPSFAGDTDATYDYPTKAVDIDDDIIKIAAHAQANCTPELLGINNFTSREGEILQGANYKDKTPEELLELGQHSAFFGIFGTDINESPNPYLYNYFYNLYAKTAEKTMSPMGTYTVVASGRGPMGADVTPTAEYNGTTIASLYLRPEILLGIAGADEKQSYPYWIKQLPENKNDDKTDDYDPYLVEYKATTTYDFLKTCRELSNICDEITAKTGKVTRYYKTSGKTAGDITSDLEKYVKGTQCYVLSQLDKNELSKKTVAIVDAKNSKDGKYVCVSTDCSTQSTTSASRVCEFLADTTVNIATRLNKELITDDGTVTGKNEAQYYALNADEILDADLIIVAGVQMGSVDEETFRAELVTNAGTDNKKHAQDIEIMSTMFSPAGSIGANSVENLLGMIFWTSWCYPEYLNEIYEVAYWYQNFYHITDTKALQTSISANLLYVPNDVQKGYSYTTDLTAYDPADVESKIIEGMKYYENNKEDLKDLYMVQKDGEWEVDWTRGIGVGEDAVTVEKAEDGNWYAYQYGNKLENASGWILVDSDYYYIDNAGLASTGWKAVGGKWYYFASNAKMVTGWAQIGGKWYYMNNWGAMVTGWAQVSGKWYYFNTSGAMVTGWAQVSGKWYYFNASGAMVTGWAQVSGKWYYFNASGAMVTGWAQISGKWYYFNASGAMVTGWAQISGKWYYFNNSGAMLTGTQRIGGKTYRFNSSGAWIA